MSIGLHMLSYSRSTRRHRKSRNYNDEEWLTTVQRGDVSARSTAFLTAVPEDWNSKEKTYQSSDSETRHLETARRRARERLVRLEFELQEMEVALGINERWTPWTPQYKEALTYIYEHRYHRALQNLQRLVVQRLFELHRLNLGGVGEWRTWISTGERVLTRSDLR